MIQINRLINHEEVYEDERGLSKSIILPYKNCYTSKSEQFVFRGFHGQKGQSKVLYVLSGAIIDYIFNPLTGELSRYIIDDNNKKFISIEDGMLHGFIALKPSVLLYSLSEPQDKNKEYGFHYKSILDGRSITSTLPTLILSDRDRSLPDWKLPEDH